MKDEVKRTFACRRCCCCVTRDVVFTRRLGGAVAAEQPHLQRGGGSAVHGVGLPHPGAQTRAAAREA